MNTTSSNLNIVHKPEIGRFEAIVDGLRCEADYLLDGHIVRMTHTGVPAQLEGRGIAAALVKAALTWARAQGHQVAPICSYVRVYIKRHPEWQDLVA
ncbi:GNAT family N-acetyltransferase [Aquabacterium sp.]|uniref:GNAT family N-acetyltransferase n=1 Tax=Aquabacterium sp. TaxID=1872578 RepID=UPI00403825CB